MFINFYGLESIFYNSCVNFIRINMSTLKACPNCKSEPAGTALGGTHFTVYQCKDCNRYYCYNCDGSKSGKRCPHCYSDERKKHGVARA